MASNSKDNTSLQAVEFIERTTNLDVELTAEERQRERKLKWKVDLTILPLLVTVYFVAQMGRSDLGNAKIAGMDEDLDLSPKEYSNVASIFYVGYLVFQLPGVLLVRKIGPPYLFGGAMIIWGTITVCTVVIHNYASLMVIRLLVGASEAFVSGAVFYLSFWYPYDELATRGAIYFSMAALAGAFNGLIAYAVTQNLAHANNWAPWRWIFLIEGVLPVGWAFVIMALLPSTPETVRFFFTEDEKALLIKRSRRAQNTGESKIRPKLILRVLTDHKFWMLVSIESALQFCLNTFSNFLPAILHGFGWSSVKSQLMTVIIYACAWVSILFWSRISDKIQRRGLVVLVNMSVAAVGYILLLTITGPSGRFASTCVLAIGIYPQIVVTSVWLATMNVGYTYRASAVALANSISQAVAIAGNQAYVDPPLYQKGHAASLALVVFAAVMTGILLFTLRRENRKKRREQWTDKAREMRKLTIDDIGNRHPDHFYCY